MRLDSMLTVVHVSALLVWIGAVLSAYVAARATSVDDATRQVIARRVFKWLAQPAFILALVFGTVRLGLDWRHYLVTTHFMHVKLSLALVAIVAHHFLGARIRAASTAQAFRGPATTAAVVTFALSCLAAVFVIVVRPM